MRPTVTNAHTSILLALPQAMSLSSQEVGTRARHWSEGYKGSSDGLRHAQASPDAVSPAHGANCNYGKSARHPAACCNRGAHTRQQQHRNRCKQSFWDASRCHLAPLRSPGIWHPPCRCSHIGFGGLEPEGRRLCMTDSVSNYLPQTEFQWHRRRSTWHGPWFQAGVRAALQLMRYRSYSGHLNAWLLAFLAAHVFFELGQSECIVCACSYITGFPARNARLRYPGSARYFGLRKGVRRTPETFNDCCGLAHTPMLFDFA